MTVFDFDECLVKVTCFPKIEGQTKADSQYIDQSINILQSDSGKHLAAVWQKHSFGLRYFWFSYIKNDYYLVF